MAFATEGSHLAPSLTFKRGIRVNPNAPALPFGNAHRAHRRPYETKNCRRQVGVPIAL